MKRMVAACALLAAACTEAPQTYRDLDQLGRDYQREMSTPPQSADEATQRDTCGAARHRGLVGTSAAGIDRASLPAQTRVITPETMVTQDFSPYRLNVIVGTDGKVGSLRCF